MLLVAALCCFHHAALAITFRSQAEAVAGLSTGGQHSGPGAVVSWHRCLVLGRDVADLSSSSFISRRYGRANLGGVINQWEITLC